MLGNIFFCFLRLASSSFILSSLRVRRFSFWILISFFILLFFTFSNIFGSLLFRILYLFLLLGWFIRTFFLLWLLIVSLNFHNATLYKNYFLKGLSIFVNPWLYPGSSLSYYVGLSVSLIQNKEIFFYSILSVPSSQIQYFASLNFMMNAKF